MSWDFLCGTAKLTLMSWDLENDMRFIFSGAGISRDWHRCLSILRMIIIVFQKLNILGIPIENASSFAFWGLPYPEEVSINECQLSEVPSNAPIANTLRMLSLSDNSLTSFPENYFDDCSLLHSIYFGGNLLTATPNVGKLNATIKHIDMGYNKITSIEPLYFVSMTKLEHVNFSNNLIIEILFDNIIWPVIYLIDLIDNRLTSINIDGLKSVLGKLTVGLAGNPWHCDRRLCWLRHCNFQAKPRPGDDLWFNCPGTESVLLEGDMICKSPDERKNQAINETGNPILGKEYHGYTAWQASGPVTSIIFVVNVERNCIDCFIIAYSFYPI